MRFAGSGLRDVTVLSNDSREAPTNQLDWRQFTASFTATSATTNITFFNGSAPSNFQSGLDNVSLSEVSVVPEPASMVILGVGSILSFAGVRRRREHACPAAEPGAAAEG